jgi:hypothetical protein
MAETTRVYHPDLNTWYDVSNPDEWAEAGWRKTKPAHIDDSDDPKPSVPKSTPKTVKGRKAAAAKKNVSVQQQAAAGAGTLE